MRITLVTSALVLETETHKFIVDASVLGLAPGHWPKTLETDLGNGLPFKRVRALPDDAGVLYCQEFGCIQLTVLND